jgi:uncharacterized membrane protein
MRLGIPILLGAMLWTCIAGIWLHDWRVIAGSVLAFVGICLVDAYEVSHR